MDNSVQHTMLARQSRTTWCGACFVCRISIRADFSIVCNCCRDVFRVDDGDGDDRSGDGGHRDQHLRQEGVAGTGT